MADNTLYADISYFQHALDDSYQHPFVAFRSNDGDFIDPNFHINYAWSTSAVARGRLEGFLVYYVFEPAIDSSAIHRNLIGSPHPRMATMVDVENWQGKIRGDHSATINAERNSLINWYGGNRLRQVAYGNESDLASMYPNRGDIHINLASWGSQRPAYPNKIAQQISATYPGSPFGSSDMNASEYNPTQFAQLLGLTSKKPVPPAAPGVSRVNSQHVSKPGVFRLVSPNRRYVATFQTDGNFVLYDWINQRAIWNSGTVNKGATQFAVQNDGNLVIRRGSKALWSSNTYGQGKTFLQVQDDSNLVLYRTKDNHPIWVNGSKL